MLPSPQAEQLAASLEVCDHLHVEPTLEVNSPVWIVGIRCSLDLDVPPDGNARGIKEPRHPRGIAVWVAHLPLEDPVLRAQSSKVTCLDPFSGFAQVSASRPPPEAAEDGAVHPREGFRADHVPVVVRPAPDDGIEHLDQFSGAGLLVRLDEGTHFFQERVDVLLGGSDEEFAAMLADRLAQEVEAVFDRRDPSFLHREFQAPRAEELHEEGLDLLAQRLAGSTGDDEVVGVAHEVDERSWPPSGTWEACLEGGFQSVEGEVGQGGRDDPTLRSARFGRVQDAPFHEASFEPLGQDGFIRWRVAQQPLVADPVKTRPDVGFQDPGSVEVTAQHLEALLHRVRRGSLLSEPVGVRVPLGLGDGVQGQQVKRLHGPILHRRDTQRAALAVALGDVDPAQWLRAVAPASQLTDGRRLALRRVPERPVHPAGSFAPVLCHPPDGKSLAGQRAGEQALQGFDLAPPARPRCLDDTRLEPSHVTMDQSPVDGVPVLGRCVGSRTNRGTRRLRASFFGRPLLCFLGR